MQNVDLCGTQWGFIEATRHVHVDQAWETAWMAVEHAPVTRTFSHQPNNVDLPKQNWLPCKDKRGHQHQCITCVFRNGKPSKLKHNAFCIPKSQISVKKKFQNPRFHHVLTIFHQQKSLDFWKNFAAACGSVVRQNVAKSTSSVSLDFRQVVGVGHGKTWPLPVQAIPDTHTYIYIHICDVPMLYINVWFISIICIYVYMYIYISSHTHICAIRSAIIWKS